MKLFRLLFAVTALIVLAAGPAAAEDATDKYPTQPIRMIVPFAPGGASDFAARLIQPGMAAALGQQIVIENRAGAAGNIGMEIAARAAPDGYTVFLGNVGTVCINPSLFAEFKLKPEEDFQPVSLVASTPGLLIANPKFPATTVKELIAYVKSQKPGEVNFASPGSGSLNRLEMELFAREAGLEMTHVPYKGGAGPAVTDILGGHVPIMFVTISSAIQQVKAGRLRALGITTLERSPELPDVPTMAEQGYSKQGSTSWQGLLVPAKTPRPIVEKLHAAVLSAMSDPVVRKRMEEGAVYPITSKSPEEFRDYIRRETARWSQAVKDTGAQPD